MNFVFRVLCVGSLVFALYPLCKVHGQYHVIQQHPSQQYQAPGGPTQLGGQIVSIGAQQIIGSGQYRSPNSIGAGSFVHSGAAHAANGMIRSNGNAMTGRYGFQNAQNYNAQGGIATSSGTQTSAVYQRSGLGHAASGNFQTVNGTKVVGSSRIQNPGNWHGTTQFANSNMRAGTTINRQNGVQKLSTFYRGSNGSAANADSSFRNWGQMNTRAQYKSANGSAVNGAIVKNNGSTSTAAHYRNHDGSQYNGNVHYRNMHHMNGQGRFQTANGNSSALNFSRQTGKHVGNGHYENSAGQKYQGAYDYQNINRFGVSGGYSNGTTGYSGSVVRNGNRAIINGQMQRPGLMPGTREKYYGSAVVNGRDSNINGGVEVTDTATGTRLGAGQGQLNRRGLNKQSNVGVAGFGMGQNSNVRFSGVNSRFQNTTTRSYGNIGSITNSYNVSRQGVNTNNSANIGGYQWGVEGHVGQQGVKGTVRTPIDWKKFRNSISNAAAIAQQQLQQIDRSKQVQKLQRQIKIPTVTAPPTVSRTIQQTQQEARKAQQQALSIQKQAQRRAEAARRSVSNAGSRVIKDVAREGENVGNTIYSGTKNLQKALSKPPSSWFGK